MVGSIIFLVMFVVAAPVTMLGLYKVLNPEHGIESWDYANYNSFTSWKSSYGDDTESDKKSTDQELVDRYNDFRKTALITSKRTNSESAIVAGIFTVLAGFLLPVHYRIMSKKSAN